MPLSGADKGESIMPQQGQVRIGREFFAKIKLDYADWQWALIREFLQNSFDAPGSKNVYVECKDATDADGVKCILTVGNDGAPMTRDILENKLLTLGGSGKNFEGENTGGFGVAKSLLYYCHKSFAIRTGNLVVQGEGAQYTITEVADGTKGTISTVLVEGAHAAKLLEQARRFSFLSQWKGNLVVDGQLLPCALSKGARRKDLEWGVIYTNKSFENMCVVRINGQPMFTMHTRFKGCVLVELNGKALQVLTSNRDALKGSYQSALSEFLTAVAIDKKSALREQKAEYKRYEGEKQKAAARAPKAQEGGLAALGLADAIKQVVGGGAKPEQVAELRNLPMNETDLTPEQKAEAAPGGFVSVAISHETVKTVTLGPDFVLKNCSGLKTPVYFTPGDKFSDGARGIVLAWTAVLLKLYQVAGVGGEFSVGFVFDEESEAEFERSTRYGNVYYINPVRIVRETPSKLDDEGKDVGRRHMESRFTSAWSDRHELIALACHEFVHGAFGLGEHDEDYANKLTDVQILAFKHYDELCGMCKPPRSTEPREAKKLDAIFGHAVTAVIRWMGKAHFSFDEAMSVLNSMECEVAEGTVRTQLQCGKKGQRGEPAALTDEQATELKELRHS